MWKIKITGVPSSTPRPQGRVMGLGFAKANAAYGRAGRSLKKLLTPRYFNSFLTVQIYTPEKRKDPKSGKWLPNGYSIWRDQCRQQLRKEFWEPFTTDASELFRVDLVFLFPRPKAMQWATKEMPRVPAKGAKDVDNLAKCVLDAATYRNEKEHSQDVGLWPDDNQVAKLVVEKWIAAGGEEPGCEMTVQRYNPQPVQVDDQPTLF